MLCTVLLFAFRIKCIGENTTTIKSKTILLLKKNPYIYHLDEHLKIVL